MSVPCFQVKIPKLRESVIVKGDIVKWMMDNGIKVKRIKDKEVRFYVGKYRCEIVPLTTETIVNMREIFGSKYDPYTA